MVPGLDSFSSAVLGTATSAGWEQWLHLGIGVILGTLVGGLVLFGVFAALGRAFGESMHTVNAFLLVRIANLVNFFGVIGLLSASVPMLALALPLLIWFGLTKAFFSELSWKHVLIVGIVGYVANLLVVPVIVSAVSGFLPF